ncbi:amidohydrolase family protein [Streptomyces sp. NPDC001604]|uniref:amidohydrolase family protein n=1 Tax=Streptomyces sp. NPDC001604 TaxID=3364593 RepID=UPI0036CD206A
MSRILLRGAQVITMTPDRPDSEHTDVLVNGDRIAWATVDGAKALGLTDRVGRIEAGMQADLVAVDARALNLWPAHDPVATALHADIANIEAVMVAGTWRKRDHALLASGLDKVKDQLRESGERLLHSIGPAGSPG